MTIGILNPKFNKEKNGFYHTYLSQSKAKLQMTEQ